MAHPQPPTKQPQGFTSPHYGPPPNPNPRTHPQPPLNKNSARDALRQCLPDALRSDVTFAQSLKDDVTINRWLANLLYNLNET